MTLVPYDLNASPTVAATSFFKALVANHETGAPILDSDGTPLVPLNAGQGAEPRPLPTVLQQIFESTKASVSGLYNAPVRPVHTALADFYRRFLGVDARTDNTFYAPLMGRSFQTVATQIQLSGLLNVVREGRTPAVLVPSTTWPMIKDIYAAYEPILYDPSWSAAQIADFAQKQAADKNIVPLVLYLNYPHNPTGASMTDFKPIMTVVDRLNADHPRMMVVVDNAYYHVAPRMPDGSSFYLETGLNELNLKGATPIVIAISGSKALGLANPGNAVAIVSDNIKAPFGAMATTMGFRQAGLIGFEDALVQALDPQYDTIWLDRFADLTARYAQNRAALVAAFGDNVYAGDPNLVGLVGFDTKDVMNRVVQVGGETIITTDVAHLVWAIGNMTATAVVDNGIHPHDGKALLRFAFPGDPTAFAARMPVIKRAIETITASPCVAPDLEIVHSQSKTA